MTSDAKIGLLLGLVFIFVIAFIINGLPNLKPQTTRAEVSTNMVSLTEGDIGIADTAQNEVEQDWRGLVVQEEPEAENPSPADEQATPAVGSPAESGQVADYPEIRFEGTLPRIENLLERITAGLQSPREQTSTVNMDVPSSAPPEQGPGLEPSPQPKPQESATRTADQPKPAAGTKHAEKIYVVADGESLSSVAKKVYGSEEGNRIVNVNRIYEANKSILASVDDVRAGQKLVIPPLPQPVRVLNPNKPSDVLPSGLFERLESLKRPIAQAPATNAQIRWYTVQDGDNLWKIASSQLGAGARYDEIAKLNTDLLKDASRVGPGMKIRLPVK